MLVSLAFRCFRTASLNWLWSSISVMFVGGSFQSLVVRSTKENLNQSVRVWCWIYNMVFEDLRVVLWVTKTIGQKGMFYHIPIYIKKQQYVEHVKFAAIPWKKSFFNNHFIKIWIYWLKSFKLIWKTIIINMTNYRTPHFQLVRPFNSGVFQCKIPSTIHRKQSQIIGLYFLQNYM